MGQETRVIEKSVWVCDLCGEESDYKNVIKCSSCGGEVCPNCRKMYHFRLERHTPSKGGGMHIISIDTHNEGLSATYCSKCSSLLEGKLMELGFKQFSHDWNPL